MSDQSDLKITEGPGSMKNGDEWNAANVTLTMGDFSSDAPDGTVAALEVEGYWLGESHGGGLLVELTLDDLRLMREWIKKRIYDVEFERSWPKVKR